MQTSLKNDTATAEHDSVCVTADYRDGTLSVSVCGEIDHHASAALRKKVDRELYFYRPKTVILHLDSVTFMDSAGLGFFMGRYQLCKTIGAEFRIADPPPRIEKILTLSGMDRLLTVDRVYRSGKPSNEENRKKQEETNEHGIQKENDTESAENRISCPITE